MGSSGINMVYNGYFKLDEEIKAAHASDTLARKLIKNGEEHKLNFPDDENEVWAEKKETSSNYFGVSWNKKKSKWQVQRRSKTSGKMMHNGDFDVDEDIKAAHASDTLARCLIANGEEGHELNFPDDETEVWPETQNKKRKR